MNFELSQEQKILQRSVREFCARAIIPHAARWNEEARFPMEVIEPIAQLGLLGIHIPERYGGAGMGMLDLALAVEELSRADASLGLTVASHNLLCMDHIYLAGSEAQRERYLHRLASGRALGAWCLTEPGSGSDAGAARTRAVRREGPCGVEWVLSGSKSFITQGSVAEIYVVLASTTPARKQKGLTAFVVEKGTQGLRPGRLVEKMGLWASDTADIVLDDVVVPDAQRLGQVDQGFVDTARVLDRGRIGIGAWAVGIGRAAFEAARSYSQQRVQFGKPISEFQAIRTMLADMATELDAARLLVWRAAVMQDCGQRTTRESSVAKLYASQAAARACDAAVQIHGGYGYARDFPVERYLRDVKLAEIGEGTSEIQKLVIAREVLKGSRT
ncbi:MAG: acyl-CoA dehydrogenase family protein [Deltaproteobacteria bacterium]|nr:acyl-CoA dehydrogenase family protein [Deltaproteobacteria bacterium]